MFPPQYYQIHTHAIDAIQVIPEFDIGEGVPEEAAAAHGREKQG